MASSFVNRVVDVSDQPTLICTVPPGTSSVTVQNIGDAVVLIGGSEVATSGETQGIELGVGQPPLVLMCADADANDLYAIAVDGASAVAYLHS